MKRISSIFSILLILSLFGCSGGKNHGLTEQQKTDYDTQKTIQEQVESAQIPKGYSSLLADGGFVTVLCRDGETTVTINVFKPYTIPYIAEVFLPTAQEAATAAGTTLSTFSVNSSDKDQDAFASWSTSDGEKGTLTDNTSGENVVKMGLTIEQLYEEYSDYQSNVSTLIELGRDGLAELEDSESEQTAITRSYWVNPDTKKFHNPTCSYIQGGYSTTESRNDLIAKGYSPCGHCNP